MRADRATALYFVLIAAVPAPALAGEPAAGGPLPKIVPTLDEGCRKGAQAEEIVVCGRREERRSPYRIPPPPERFDPGGNIDSVSRERHRLYEHADVGINSCSTVGPGGWTGCDLSKWKNGYEQWGGKPPHKRKRPSEY